MNSLLLDVAFINALSSNKSDFYEKYFKQSLTGLKKNENGFSLGLIDKKYYKDNLEHPYNNRANKLALYAIKQLEPIIDIAKAKYGKKRISIILGLTDNGSEEFSEFLLGNYENYDFIMWSMDMCCSFLKQYLDIEGFSFTVSTACTSSAGAIIRGDELIKNNVCDVAIVGGVDIITSSVFLGFSSLEVVDKDKTIPYSKNRKGINLGEGAAFFILARENFTNQNEVIKLKGHYENSDAFHMTSPNVDGLIPSQCIKEALKMANLGIEDIDYINLHGTGTDLNDKMEAKTLNILNAQNIYCSSNKTIFGHTVGTASAMELAVCFIALSDMNKDNIIPMHLYDNEYDDTIDKINIADKETRANRLQNILSLSFAFGGSNACLIIGK